MAPRMNCMTAGLAAALITVGVTAAFADTIVTQPTTSQSTTDKPAVGPSTSAPPPVVKTQPACSTQAAASTSTSSSDTTTKVVTNCTQ